MVSLWPWRRIDSSPASFEKTLLALSTKIATTQTLLDKTYFRSRRVRVLATLYLGFAYLVYAIVLVLVLGWRNLGALEWSAVAGGPVLIYAVRVALGAVFGYRIDVLEVRLKEHQEERAKTIQKLKDATKYDSTLQLLEKYGGADQKPAKKGGRRKGDVEGPVPEHADGAGGEGDDGDMKRSAYLSRTGMMPPPTANIQRQASPQPSLGRPITPQQQQHQQHLLPSPQPSPRDVQYSAEFAPNAFGISGTQPRQSSAAFSASSALSSSAPAVSHWYDRILDTLLGEDETSAKNRIALICGRCRLINGQAPPGTRSLAEIGVWKCMACGASNGEDMDEGKRIVREVLGRQRQGRGGKRGGGDSTTDRLTTDEDDESSDIVEAQREDGGSQDEEIVSGKKGKKSVQGQMRERKDREKD